MLMNEQLAWMIHEQRLAAAADARRSRQLVAAARAFTTNTERIYATPLSVRRQIGRRIMRVGARIANDRQAEMVVARR